MVKILVNPESLKALSSQLQRTAGDVRALEGRLSNVLASLEWEVRQKAGVESRWHNARSSARTITQRLEEMARFLNTKARAFQDADRQGVGGMDQIIGAYTTAIREWIMSPYGRINSYPQGIIDDLLRLGLLGAFVAVPTAAVFALPALIPGIVNQIQPLLPISPSIKDEAPQKPPVQPPQKPPEKPPQKPLLSGEGDKKPQSGTQLSTLGVLSAKYESTGNPGIIANNPGDPGGKSYGAWQLASKRGSVDAFLIWLKGVNYDYYQQLTEAKRKDGNVFGANFDKTWKQIAKNDRAGFLQVQHDYIKHAYYDVAAQKLKDKYRFDISTKSPALQNVLWSTAVQHGANGAVSIFAKVFKDVGKDSSDEQIITRVYDERQKVDIYFRNCSDEVKKSVYNRFLKEKADALKMLNGQ